MNRTRAVDPSTLVAALQAFAKETNSRGKPLPPTITIRELVDGGYLKASDAKPFRAVDVSFSLSADEGKPQQVLIRARLPDGSVYEELADGSIQQAVPRK